MAQAPRDENYIPAALGVTDDSSLTPQALRVDPTTLRLKVDSNSGDGSASVGVGRSAIEVAGSAVRLSTTSVACKKVWIQCSSANGALTNGGLIVVGDSNVVAAEATRKGIALYPTQGQWFTVSNLNLLYIDSLDNNAEWHYYYET